ncbi:uncharacterized protein BJ171DRAFT_587754 [Polychytrium aggregatum]|uniref:uncharacterized protein n=1 Tax=Polychytrium aggregatum TaxID=110093 RepID=UPI0022FE7D55|nr:uncharacterized protein BJ171DRAFT_587754 [Polychytrium aggregatum]KAI9193357.1 hypothetical protein BJ171DRAFT_587754 [Polychytrium aggregatum]
MYPASFPNQGSPEHPQATNGSPQSAPPHEQEQPPAQAPPPAYAYLPAPMYDPARGNAAYHPYAAPFYATPVMGGVGVYSAMQPNTVSPLGGSRRSRNISEVGPVFKPTKQAFALWDSDHQRPYVAVLYPKIDRGFFLAEGDWTCYRRNYFQVSCSFAAYDSQKQRLELPCLIDMDDAVRTVTGFYIGLSSKTANGQRDIELVQHTAKRDKGPQTTPGLRQCLPSDPALARPEDAAQQITFERIQFKSATANNGKRRAAQQYHVLVLELWARMEDNSNVRIATAESVNLVVRGRAPGHYATMSNRNGGNSEADPGYGEFGSPASPSTAPPYAQPPMMGMGQPPMMGHPHYPYATHDGAAYYVPPQHPGVHAPQHYYPSYQVWAAHAHLQPPIAPMPGEAPGAPRHGGDPEHNPNGPTQGSEVNPNDDDEDDDDEEEGDEEGDGDDRTEGDDDNTDDRPVKTQDSDDPAGRHPPPSARDSRRSKH